MGSLYLYLNPPFRLDTPFGTHANSADTDQMLLRVAFDLGLHCFLSGISMQKTIKVQTFTETPHLEMESSK